MAAAQFSSAPLPYAPPMASSGYGKRSVLGQRPRRPGDFAHLPPREAAVAAHIDRLPEGAAIDVKTLARELPDYGQMAVRSALTRLSEAGHLRRIRENVGVGCTRWVFRTYFSRAARDDTWWAAFLAGDVVDVPALPDVAGSGPASVPAGSAGLGESLPPPEVRPAPVPAVPSARPRPAGADAPPVPRTPPVPGPQRSEAYEVLAGLGRTDPRMTLSAAECAALEGLAAQWLERGSTAAQMAQALTAGLPPHVHSPGALARSRLVAKLPPEPSGVPLQLPVARRLLECTDCGVPGSPEALPGGVCRTCRGEPVPSDADEVDAEVVRARVALLRVIHRGHPEGSSPCQ